MPEVLDLVKIEAIGPHGILSGGSWFKVKDPLKASFVKGKSYSVKTTIGPKGGKEIVGIEGTALPLLDPNTNKAQYVPPSTVISKDDYWKRKEERDVAREQRDIAKEPLIQRSGIMQASLKAVSAHVAKLDDLVPAAIKVAEEALVWIKNEKV